MGAVGCCDCVVVVVVVADVVVVEKRSDGNDTRFRDGSCL